MPTGAGDGAAVGLQVSRELVAPRCWRVRWVTRKPPCSAVTASRLFCPLPSWQTALHAARNGHSCSGRRRRRTPTRNALQSRARIKRKERLILERTPAERELACSFTQESTRFNVRGLQIDHHRDRSVTMTYRLGIEQPNHPEERWEVALPWGDTSFVDVLTSPAPEPGRLDMLASLVRSLLGNGGRPRGMSGRRRRWGAACDGLT